MTTGCPCECNSGGFCGGCGHAGCGGRNQPRFCTTGVDTGGRKSEGVPVQQEATTREERHMTTNATAKTWADTVHQIATLLTDHPWFSFPAGVRTPAFGPASERKRPALFWGSDFIAFCDDIESVADIARKLNGYMVDAGWDQRMRVSDHTVRMIDLDLAEGRPVD